MSGIGNGIGRETHEWNGAHPSSSSHFFGDIVGHGRVLESQVELILAQQLYLR